MYAPTHHEMPNVACFSTGGLPVLSGLGQARECKLAQDGIIIQRRGMTWSLSRLTNSYDFMWHDTPASSLAQEPPLRSYTSQGNERQKDQSGVPRRITPQV